MLELFCPVKHDLYITNVHVSYRDTVYRYVSDVDVNSDI